MPASKTLAEILKKAVQVEHQGQWFYSLAASQCKDEKGRQVFEQLAREELQHADFLRAQAKALREKGKLNAALVLGRPAALDGPSPIFSDDIRARLSQAHYEMTALGVGIELELSSRNFYRRQAQVAKDKIACEFFTMLADWEAGHYRALLAQQKLLQEDYWHQAGFAPF